FFIYYMFSGIIVSSFFYNINKITSRNKTIFIICLSASFITAFYFIVSSYKKKAHQEVCLTNNSTFSINLPSLNGMYVSSAQKDVLEKTYDFLKVNSDKNNQLLILHNYLMFYCILHQKPFGSLLWYHPGVTFTDSEIPEIENNIINILTKNPITYILINHDLINLNKFKKLSFLLNNNGKLVFSEIINGTDEKSFIYKINLKNKLI
ncbi:hypothetical protein KA977_15260, partial [Candidatus Dependentiae bacterium]|nr:hypothetical protein [Candidatus Dependentiae bacterium]